MKPKTRYMSIVLFICVGIRLGLFGLSQPWALGVGDQVALQRDALGYHQLATTLIESRRFALSSTGGPDALRTPLYPLFVAIIYSLFGYRPWIVILVQLIVDTVSCFLLLSTLSHLFDRRVALISSLFYALDPHLVFYSLRVLSDTFFVSLLVVAFYLFSVAITAESQRKTLLNYGLSSLFMGLATLVRPIPQYIPAILLVFFLMSYWRQPKAAIRYSILSLFVFVLTLSPWLFRNYNAFGFVSLSTSGPYNLLILDVVPMEMARRHEDSHTVRTALLYEADRMMAADGLQPQELNPFQRAQYYQRLAIKYITGDSLAFGQSYLLGVFHTFFNIGTKGYADMLRLPMAEFDIKAYTNIFDLAKAFLREKGAVGLFVAGLVVPYLLVSYSGAALGFLISWKRYDRRFHFFILLFGSYFIVTTGAAGLARFKLPSIPFYLTFTGIGFNYLYERVQLRRKARAGS